MTETTRGFRQLLAVGLTTLLLGGCGDGDGPQTGNFFGPPEVAPPTQTGTVEGTPFPYQADSPFADVLVACTFDGNATQECPLGSLPFIGMETSNPTIADIADHMVVSHNWMGRNFVAVLEELPDDILLLLRSVTAVVIDADIRPAFYDPATGAIYLDPDFLWLSVAERNTVSTAPDPRSDFGQELQFDMPWRYVRNNEPLTIFLNADGSRDLDQIVEIMGFLLYHELAHAVDFVPPVRFAGIMPDQTVLDVIDLHPPRSPFFEAPLTSDRLKELAGVSFFGETATDAQRALQPGELVPDFANDGATQYYAYATPFEDFATLFETVMMKWHFGYDKDTAVTDIPSSGDFDDAVVSWGTRGRLGEQVVLIRALEVGQHVYPGDLAAYESFLISQPAPQRMREGDTWGDNLLLAPPGGLQPNQAPTEPHLIDYPLERLRIH